MLCVLIGSSTGVDQRARDIFGLIIVSPNNIISSMHKTLMKT